MQKQTFPKVLNVKRVSWLQVKLFSGHTDVVNTSSKSFINWPQPNADTRPSDRNRTNRSCAIRPRQSAGLTISADAVKPLLGHGQVWFLEIYHPVGCGHEVRDGGPGSGNVD